MQSHKIWRPFTQMQTALPAQRVRSAKGSRLTLQSGQQVIDAISSWWVITHGHCHPAIVDAIQKQAGQLDQVLFANFSHAPAEELVELLASLLPPSLDRFFFSDNGSTSVEVALKMCIQAHQQRGDTKRNLFVAFKQGYHGDTVGSMSVGGRGTFTQPYQGMLFRVLHAEHPTQSWSAEKEWTADFDRLLNEHGDYIAGVIIEPLVQGAGGMIVWPKQAVQHICRRAKEAGCFLIFDEVMTGFGRTGRLFAFEHLDVKPDFLCLSKGLTGGALPLALTVTSEEVYQCFLHESKNKMLFHGHSFTGNPISCAAACASVKLFQQNDMANQWQRIEQQHRLAIESLQSSAMIDGRVCGTIAAIEFKTKDRGYASGFAERVYQYALKQDVFLRPLGHILYVMPPYCVTDQELDHIWNVIRDIIKQEVTEIVF